MELVNLPQGSWLKDIFNELGIIIVKDERLKDKACFEYSYSDNHALVRVGVEPAFSTYLHELIHAIQVLSSPVKGEKNFCFGRRKLRRYLLSKGFKWNEELALNVESHFYQMVEEGKYDLSEYTLEFPAFYISLSVQGIEILESIWKEAKPLLQKENSFWSKRNAAGKSLKLVLPPKPEPPVMPKMPERPSPKACIRIWLFTLLLITAHSLKPMVQPWVQLIINNVQQQVCNKNTCD
jgi:hypothetical protein